MPYITKEQVKTKREAIKKAFPSKDGWKFSITSDFSSIYVAIMESPIRFGEDGSYEQLNHFYLDNYTESMGEQAVTALKKINEILTSDNRIESVDGDYGNIPNFYTNIHIAKWNKGFKFVEK